MCRIICCAKKYRTEADKFWYWLVPAPKFVHFATIFFVFPSIFVKSAFVKSAFFKSAFFFAGWYCFWRAHGRLRQNPHGKIYDSLRRMWTFLCCFNCLVLLFQGVCAEKTAKKLGITREDQDNYAISAYKKSAAAVKVTPSCFDLAKFSLAKTIDLFNYSGCVSLKDLFFLSSERTIRKRNRLRDGSAKGYDDLGCVAVPRRQFSFC